jgi:hypothetical protein
MWKVNELSRLQHKHITQMILMNESQYSKELFGAPGCIKKLKLFDLGCGTQSSEQPF